MSPTSTSEPPPPLPEPPVAPVAAVDPLDPAVPGTARLLRAFLGDTLLAFLALVVASTVLIGPMVLVQAVRESGGDPANVDIDAVTHSLLPQITAASVLAMLMAGMMVWWFRARRLPVLAAPMPAMQAYPLALVAGVGIQGACLAVAMLAQAGGTTIAPSNADPVQDLVRQIPWLAWITVIVVAPLAEELLFRHVLLRRFAVAGRGLLGVAVTSVLFAAMHELTPGAPSWPAWLATFALYATMGAGFGAFYLWTRRYGAAVVAHGACNLAAMSLAAFSPL